ncbi:uncharacterized protein LOC133187469 [Saccostrea echinata]|uniref:uncharacterized protein LOC133187469 n=1 Tax=Saccostrea echinata TaxID=191078 RepID=UPI002A80D42E|nr:uncharacterized protein LOC133187469 [Saccostrea echinata]
MSTMRNKFELALLVAYLSVTLILTKSGTESLEVNGVTIGFNKTCSSNPNITCFVYFISKSGCSAKAATAFPHLYRVSEDNRFPEKPASMETQVFSREFIGNRKYYTGLRVTLMSPVTGSFDVLKGFELIYTYNTDMKYGCLIFDLSAQKLTYNDVVKTGFWTEIWPMSPADPPIVFLVSRSLPPAPSQYDRYLNVTENVQNGEFSVCVPNGGCGSVVTPSSQWVTTIFYKTTTNSSGPFNNLEMSFALGPPEYNFNEYTVSLHKVNNSKPIIALNLPKERPHHVFKGLSPGKYVIKVIPYDKHFNDRNLCLCRNEFQACLACTTTVTKEITLGHTLSVAVQAPSVTTESIPLTDTESTAITPSSDDNAVLAAVLGSVLGLILVLIIAFFTIQWRKKYTGGNTETTEKIYTNLQPQHINGNDNPTFRKDNYEILRVNGRVLPLKTVFLAYAEDHECHKEVVKAFASFMEKHCRCNVIFAPWRMSEIMQDKFRWVINSMDQADYTVVVNSFTAYQQFQHWKSNDIKHSKIFQGSPLADLFIPILNQTCIRLNNPSEYRKFIMVRFEYTQKEHTITELNSGGEYVLMKHLQEFLCHIHQLGQHKTKMEDVGLAFVNDFKQLVEGAALDEKIQKAKAHEARFPRRMDSESSNDSGLDSAESLPENDKQTIRKMYEENYQSEVKGDSITEVIGYYGDSETDDYPGPRPCPSPEDHSDPTFHPPSVIDPTDDSSEVLVEKMISINFQNGWFESTQTAKYDNENVDPDENFYSDEESCRSIGGKSV